MAKVFLCVIGFDMGRVEPDRPGQTNVELTGKKPAQLVYDRDIGDDSFAHLVMGLISRHGKKRIRHFITYRKDNGKLLKIYDPYVAV